MKILRSEAPAIHSTNAGKSGEHPDAELLELGRLLEVAWAAERATWRVREERPSSAIDDPAEAITDAVTDLAGDLARKIIATKATSIEGLRVKARAAVWQDAELMNPRRGESNGILSLLVDLLGGSPWDDAPRDTRRG